MNYKKGDYVLYRMRTQTSRGHWPCKVTGICPQASQINPFGFVYEISRLLDGHLWQAFEDEIQPIEVADSVLTTWKIWLKVGNDKDAEVTMKRIVEVEKKLPLKIRQDLGLADANT